MGRVCGATGAILGLAAALLMARTRRADAVPPGRGWQVVWNDEFQGSTLDAAKWDRCPEWERPDG